VTEESYLAGRKSARVAAAGRPAPLSAAFPCKNPPEWGEMPSNDPLVRANSWSFSSTAVRIGGRAAYLW
jgi:hypothetical protein